MALVQEFGYAVYGVPDLDKAVDFFRRIMQLEVSEKRDGVVLLTRDTKHAWRRQAQARERKGRRQVRDARLQAGARCEIPQLDRPIPAAGRHPFALFHRCVQTREVNAAGILDKEAFAGR